MTPATNQSPGFWREETRVRLMDQGAQRRDRDIEAKASGGVRYPLSSKAYKPGGTSVTIIVYSLLYFRRPDLVGMLLE